MTGYRCARALTLALLSFAAAGCGKDEEAGAAATRGDEPQPAASLAVSLVKPQTRTIERTVIASGPIAPWKDMQLGVELSGLRVTALHVDVGQSVAKGDVLLELDHRVLDAELRQAQAAFAEAESGVLLAKTNLARGEAMSEKHLISAADLDELRAGLVQAQARLLTTKAQRDSAQLRRDFADLRAPDDGIISKRLVQAGQVVNSGNELLRLICQGRLEWRPEISEVDLGRVVPGAKVLLQSPDGATVEGAVRAVSPGLDETTRTATVFADLSDPAALRAGVFVEGRIVVDASPAMMVPSMSVVRRDGHAYVFTVDAQQKAARVRVRTGAEFGSETEIVEGLAPEATVVARGAGFLSDGDRVRVVESKVAAQ